MSAKNLKAVFKSDPLVAVCCFQSTCINFVSYCCNLKIISLDEKGKCKSFIKTKIITKKSINEKSHREKERAVIKY